MLAVAITWSRKILEVVGLLSPDLKTLTDEERELVNEYQEKLKADVPVFKEYKGFVTQLSNNAVELDHKWVYQLEVNDRLGVGDRVSYKVYKSFENAVVKDVLLLVDKEKLVFKSVTGTIINIEGNKYEVTNKIFFDLEKVRCEFLPVLYDHIILEGDYPKDLDDQCTFDEDYSEFNIKRVLPGSTKLMTGVITSWDPETKTGLIGKDVIFHQNACDKFVPKNGEPVVCNAIEGRYKNNIRWRAESICLHQAPVANSRHVLVIAHIPKFQIVLGETKIVELSLSNHSDRECKILNVKSWISNSPNSGSGISNEIKIIPAQTTVIWPVSVVGDRLGFRKMQFKWLIENKKRRIPISTYLSYEIVQQNMDKSSSSDCSSLQHSQTRLIIPGQSKVRKPVFRKVPMKEYMVPGSLRELLENGPENILDLRIALQKQLPSLAEGLNEKNYGEWMHTLLFLEEIAKEQAYKKLETEAHLFQLRGFVVFSFPMDSEHARIVCGDCMIASKPWENVFYEGKIWETSASQIFCRFNSEFENTMRQGALYKLSFKMNRTSDRRRHQAVDLVLKNIGESWLFPSVSGHGASEPSDDTLSTSELNFQFFNSQLNTQQKNAVTSVLVKKNMPNPYVIFGPPGTGKTMTIIELVLQIYAQQPESRILVAAPTNSAVDTFGVRLLNFGVVRKEDVIRLSSYNAFIQGQIATQLMDISFIPHIGDPNSESIVPENREEVPTVYLSDLGKHKISIGTLATLSILNSVGLGQGFFTHVIIDEAGQCHEPDTLLPIALVDPSKTQLVLAGDPLQLGPTISSHLATQYNLNCSFLDRLTSTYLYRKKVDAFESTSGYNPRLITKLIYNYRALPKLVELTSEIFYDNDLLPVISANESREAGILKNLEVNGYALGAQMDSLVFINVDSREEQMDGNHSWFNSGEVLQVMTVLNSLYSKGLTPDDIGVITPYSLQVRKIYELLDTFKVFSPKVASVEEFQGQERLVIITSLVRNNSGQSKKLSPFVCDAQRLNVALSRAKILNIIIGNRNTLSSQVIWTKIISKCHLINPTPSKVEDNPVYD